MKYKRLFLVATTMLFTGSAFADCVDTGDGRARCAGPVSRLYVLDDGRVLFDLVGNTGTLPCLPPYAPTYQGWWVIEKSDTNYRTWYSMLLSAAAIGTELAVVSHYEDAGSACLIQRIEWRN